MPSEVDLAQLRICYIAGTLGQGGAERQLYYILQALAQAGAAVELLSLTTGEFWEQPIRQLGVPVAWVGASGSRLRRVARIVREVRRQRPQVVQSQHFFANLYAVAAGRLAGIQDIGAIRNDVKTEVRANGRVLGPLSLRTPSMLVANSAAALRIAAGYGIDPRRLRLLENVVDTDRFTPPPPRDQAVVRVLAMGRLEPQKRFDRMLRVLADVRARTATPVEATLAGSGSLLGELQRQTAALGLGQAVRFAGASDSPADLYRAADILLLTSDHEGTPNVALEAMACGLPVVATEVGGVPEIVDHGVTGLVVDPHYEDRLAEALLDLVDHKARRQEMGARARASVEARHSTRLLTGALRRLYAEALG